ncbi:hypothetical protein BDK51DRAFT_4430, partial [Blyttiomyces helicus]
AWRYLKLRPGRTGEGGPGDFVLESGSDDDGERWAGARVLRVLEEEGVVDGCAVVSRWWGGEMLGPVRFAHIENSARDAVRR